MHAEMRQRRPHMGERTESDLIDGSYRAELSVSHDAEGREHVRVKGPPGTPFAEFDIGDTFLVHDATSHSQSWFKTRRFLFVIGGVLGAVAAWLVSETPSGLLPELLDRQLQNLGLELPSSFSDLALFTDITRNLNITDLLQPTRGWLSSSDFVVGREAFANGLEKKHAVVIVPGIVSSGLESWTTTEDISSFFRKRIWGTTNMMRAVITRKDEWIRAMSLDPDTGLDVKGVKVRSAQGLDAASFFVPGEQNDFVYVMDGVDSLQDTGYGAITVIENLAVLDYDYNDLFLASYDWRLSYGNLQVRDKYFSRLMFLIEHNKRILGKKTVLCAHSMGSLVVLYFFKWAESSDHGAGGPQWVENHIAGFINIAGTMLGVPKAMSALLSGEMRDTVELNPAGVYLLERFFSRQERTKLFRSWAALNALTSGKGGNAVWGTAENGAPDDPHNTTDSGAYIYRFRPPGEIGFRASDKAPPNLTMDDATNYLLQSTPSSYQRMLASNWSFGFERDVQQLDANNQDPTKWTNPLEVRLPYAPSMKIYCLYGVGKPTERGYIYRHEGYERDESQKAEGVADEGSAQSAPRNVLICEADDLNCTSSTMRNALDLPLQSVVYVDNSITNESAIPPIRSGVVTGEGDGTVSLLSLGSMCVEGWKRERYNPARLPIMTREIQHDPVAYNPRGGESTADHIDVLGNKELNKAVVNIVCGRDDLFEERFVSKIRDYAAKIRWEI